MTAQNVIFKKFIHKYFQSKICLSEYDFISCLSLTYFEFRNTRKTITDKTNAQDFTDSHIIKPESQKIIGIFPLCDAFVDEKMQVMPRFIKKFSKDEVDVGRLSVYFRVDKLEQSTHPIVGSLISKNEILTEVGFFGCLQIAFKISADVFRKNYFIKSRIKEKISIFKSLFIFELNYLYFKKINFEYIDKHDTLLLTNFYAPENLGLIKAFLKIRRR